MSLNTYLNGSLVGTTRIRLHANGDQGLALATAADGSSAEAGIVFDDPDSTMTVIGWMPCYVEETLCTSAPRLFTGYTAGPRTERRGHYRTLSGREIDTSVYDSNVLLQMHRLTGSDAKRPAETAVARLTWLLGSGYIPLVSDLGFVNGIADLLDPTDYTRQFSTNVLDDCCGTRQQIFFVYWDQTAHALGLFVDYPTATTFTSTLSISNVLSDVEANPTTCFAPMDAEGTFNPSEVYSDGAFVYNGGVYYGTNSATRAAFFSTVGHRDTEVENMRVGKPPTAATWMNQILLRDSVERQSINLVVRLPAAEVGLIDAGMRLSVRLSHVTNFTSFAYTRVEVKTVAQTEGTPDFYDVGLQLSTFGLVGSGGTGGGSTLPFPVQPSSPPVPLRIWENNIDPASPDGRLILWWVGIRSSYPTTTPISVPSGFTALTATLLGGNSGGADDDSGRLFYRYASNESGTFPWAGHPTGAQYPDAALNAQQRLIEFEVGTTIDQVVTKQLQVPVIAPTPFDCGGPITVTQPALLMGFSGHANFFAGSTFVPDAGVTMLAHTNSNPNCDIFIGDRTMSSAGTGSVSGTESEGARWFGATVSLFSGTAAPPLPGQPNTRPEVVTMTGATGTTASHYAANSLTVFVDNLNQTGAIVSQDPATGSFTLGFTPRTGQVVTVEYVVAA